MNLYRPHLFVILFVPILLWVLFTSWSVDWDLKITRYFYENGRFSQRSIWNFIYIYGIIPGWILIFLSVIGLGFSRFPPFRSWQKPSLYVLLTAAIGAGILIHGVFKENWGRPRPKQVVEFGGLQPFRAYYEPNFLQPEPSKSFSSGHSTMGFIFFSVAFLGFFYRSRWLFCLGIALAIGLGALLSLARIAVGGHFLSDTLGSALIMWLTAATLYCLMLRRL